jgi:hypothetical protein
MIDKVSLVVAGLGAAAMLYIFVAGFVLMVSREGLAAGVLVLGLLTLFVFAVGALDFIRED